MWGDFPVGSTSIRSVKTCKHLIEKLSWTCLIDTLLMLQDPGTSPARRIWTSIDMGTEIFVTDREEVAEWTLSDFDVILTSPNP